MNKTTTFWNELRDPGINSRDASRDLLAVLRDKYLRAYNWHSDLRNFKVICKPADLTNHCLYKDPDGRGGYLSLELLEDHFLPERAELIGLIRPTLEHPDLIIHQNDKRVSYVCQVGDDEYIKCVLNPRPHSLFFLTFYPLWTSNGIDSLVRTHKGDKILMKGKAGSYIPG